jgi:hypothetical protein
MPGSGAQAKGGRRKYVLSSEVWLRCASPHVWLRGALSGSAGPCGVLRGPDAQASAASDITRSVAL